MTSKKRKSASRIRKTQPQLTATAPIAAALAGAISRTLTTALSGKSQLEREDAALYLRAIFRKTSWAMRRLVTDVESSELLDELVRQTRFNCSLLQTAEKITRFRLKSVAQVMPDFPVLQSASTELRQSTVLFLRSIGLRSSLPGPRGSTRITKSAFGAIAREIVAHLQALVIILQGLLTHPQADHRLDPAKPEPAALKALTFFQSLKFSICVPPLTLTNWPQLWNIIATLIVTENSSGGNTDWSLCSWRDLYGDPELRCGLTARSHIGSDAEVRSHIREKIKQKVESELGITKLKKRAKKRR